MSMVRALRKAMRRNRQQFGMFFGVSPEMVRELGGVSTWRVS
ncbi:hypothetical protein FF3_01878 [Fretibacterium fastidiosum]|uniref:Uncharacterized protein n=1 Tax=Fretibacterium fastidiosum TaxID=651822 RepID=A0AB94IYW4_9BACT|nr:hypothetical protein SY1_22250 [Fretibacterium fastidiosum]